MHSSVVTRREYGATCRIAERYQLIGTDIKDSVETFNGFIYARAAGLGTGLPGCTHYSASSHSGKVHFYGKFRLLKLSRIE